MERVAATTSSGGMNVWPSTFAYILTEHTNTQTPALCSYTLHRLHGSCGLQPECLESQAIALSKTKCDRRFDCAGQLQLLAQRCHELLVLRFVHQVLCLVVEVPERHRIRFVGVELPPPAAAPVSAVPVGMSIVVRVRDPLCIPACSGNAAGVAMSGGYMSMYRCALYCAAADC